MQWFRECDIRGTYPDQVNEDLFRAIGGVIGRRCKGEGVVITGYDIRLGSPSLAAALSEGIVCSGGHVVDLGRVPTPVLYFARRYWDAAAGVMVTASHNPPEYNGIKLIFRGGPATCQDILGIQRDLASSGSLEAGGQWDRIHALTAYENEFQCAWRAWNNSNPLPRTPRLVADPGNGAWSQIAGRILERMGVRCRMLHDEPDGRFPGRSPDCSSPGSLTRLGEVVRESGAEAGLAWDGDGDRLAVVDRNGAPLTADQVGLILASGMELKGEHVLVDVKVSRKVSAAIERLGGIPIIERSAHCTLERTMIERGCLFGCEYSGHYFFRELHGADDGLYAAARFVHLLAREESIESMLSALPCFYVTPDIRVPGTQHDLDELWAYVSQSPGFRGARVVKLDGMKLELPDGWILVRRSVSEDKLSVRAEGQTPDDLARIVRLLVSALPSAQQELRGRLEAWNCGIRGS